METFAYIATRNPLPSIFKEALQRTYEVPDEPLPRRLEELLERLPEAAQAAE